MQDLNDLYYFAVVVEHGGFAAAERALGIPKSRLSRRISQLEADLGVRLLQRSTRRFAVTDVGTHVYRHAQTMLAEAQAARDAVDRLSATPRGVVRVSVPVSLAQQEIPALLPDFLALYPEVRLLFQVGNRRVDIINEGIDVAIRVRSKLDDDGELVLRTFGPIQSLLPETMCAEQLRSGELELVLPEWRLPQGICHAVFASRRGLLPAVRVFIDYLAERMPPLLEAGRVR